MKSNPQNRRHSSARRFFGSAIVVGLALVAIGCVAPAKPPVSKSPVAPAEVAPELPAAEHQIKPTSPDGKITPYDLSQAVIARSGPVPSATDRTPRNPPPPGPKALVGLSDTAIIKAFGPPSFMRKEPPAAIWQYRDPACILDLFFYPATDDAKTLRVTHAALRGRAVTAVEEMACFSRILEHLPIK